MQNSKYVIKEKVILDKRFNGSIRNLRFALCIELERNGDVKWVELPECIKRDPVTGELNKAAMEDLKRLFKDTDQTRTFQDQTYD